MKFLLYFIDFKQNQWNKVVLYFTVFQLYFIVFQLYFTDLTLFHWFVSGYDCAFQRKLRIQIKIEDFISQIMKTRENRSFVFYFHSHSLVKITTSGSIHPCFQNQWNKVFSIFIWIYSYYWLWTDVRLLLREIIIFVTWDI